MSLSENSILEFKELLEKTYNVKVTKEYAEEAAENLLNFYRILLKVDKNQQVAKNGIPIHKQTHHRSSTKRITSKT
ncbi:MAG: hypothetical protein A2089_03885 [Elusimicrobia bacterium GWD2_63_28]|nr:MAG: hypothetical protein A2089_03885 [Elusimicrobia bacterium GWD2_63_28]